MTTMSGAAYERFNALLAQWRREGRKLTWKELNEAFRLAQEETQEARPPAGTDPVVPQQPTEER